MGDVIEVSCNVSMVVAWSWFHAASMLWTMARTVSWADLPAILPYWVEGNRWYLAARYESLWAWILSSIFPRTSNSCMTKVLCSHSVSRIMLCTAPVQILAEFTTF